MKKQLEGTRAVAYKHLVISSPVIGNNGILPVQYTCDGQNINPPLDIAHIPENAISLAVIMADNHSPVGIWAHWIAWNIPVTHHIHENNKSGQSGVNSFARNGYYGPCPPYGTHHYQINVYALNTVLQLPDFTCKRQLEIAMSPYITGFGEMDIFYRRLHEPAR